MRSIHLKASAVGLRLGVAALPLLLVAGIGCAATQLPPPALTEAREEFLRAKNGIAMQLDPTDVHEADLALQKAEQAFRDEPDEASTNDLALIADRRSLIAEAQAANMNAQQQALSANKQGVALTAAQLQNARGQLGQTQQALGQTQMQLQQQQAASAAQAQQLADMQAKLKDARDTIAKIASVKDDDRGMVITLQGEVLFKTGGRTRGAPMARRSFRGRLRRGRGGRPRRSHARGTRFRIVRGRSRSATGRRSSSFPHTVRL